MSRNWVGEARMLAIGMAGTVVAMFLQPFTNGGWETYGLMAVMALSASVAFPNAGALLSRAIGQGNQGQIMGLNNAASALSRVLGPQAASMVFASVTVDGAYFLGALVVAPSILLALKAGRATARAQAAA